MHPTRKLFTAGWKDPDEAKAYFLAFGEVSQFQLRPMLNHKDFGFVTFFDMRCALSCVQAVAPGGRIVSYCKSSEREMVDDDAVMVTTHYHARLNETILQAKCEEHFGHVLSIHQQQANTFVVRFHDVRHARNACSTRKLEIEGIPGFLGFRAERLEPPVAPALSRSRSRSRSPPVVRRLKRERSRSRSPLPPASRHANNDYVEALKEEIKSLRKQNDRLLEIIQQKK